MRRGILTVTRPAVAGLAVAGLAVAGLAVAGLAVARPAVTASPLAPAAWPYLKPLAVWLATVALALSVIAGVTVARLRHRRRLRAAAA